jgi:CDP-diacylglycerol--glycerol-3-phosphate 3-phosphatidyltransferase
MKLFVVNMLTALRLGLGLLFVVLVFMNEAPAAAVTLCLIYASDYYDGFLARKWSVETNGGALFDLVADSTFVFLAYGALQISGAIPQWFFIVAVLKFAEFAATSVVLSRGAGVEGDPSNRKPRWSPVFDRLGRASGIMFMVAPLAVVGLYGLLEVNLASAACLGLELMISAAAITSSVYRIWMCTRVGRQRSAQESFG